MSMRRWLASALNRSASFVAEKYFERACENEAERRVGSINVVGPNGLRDEVSESLRILQSYYPYGYGLVQRYLRAVVGLDVPLDFGWVIGVQFEHIERFGRLRWSPDRFAGVLLRTAIYTRLTKGYGICVWRNPRAQLPALKQELRLLRIIGCDAKYIVQQEEFVAAKARRVIC
jgi:hypothetical protein